MGWWTEEHSTTLAPSKKFSETLRAVERPWLRPSLLVYFLSISFFLFDTVSELSDTFSIFFSFWDIVYWSFNVWKLAVFPHSQVLILFCGSRRCRRILPAVRSWLGFFTSHILAFDTILCFFWVSNCCLSSSCLGFYDGESLLFIITLITVVPLI